jgi:hypothetical protein
MIRDFIAYQDQPGDANHNIVYQGVNVNLTVDAAAASRDLETEIVSMETVIGERPFTVPGQTTVGGSLAWLSDNLSPGHVDARGAIPPDPPPAHSHPHQQTGGKDADDHPQYMRVDGVRSLTDPVSAPPASDADQVITMNQALGSGLNYNQVQAIIQASLAAAMNGHYAPILGPDNRRWKMAGGAFNGYTDNNGNIYVNFGGAGFNGLLSFTFMKLPFPGASRFGYVYQYEEDQLILLALSNQGAIIQFIEDIVVDRRANVAMTWLALGI